MEKNYADISEETIIKKTGKPSNEWHRILDKFNVAEKGHTLGAKHLEGAYDLDQWWAQVVVIRYEYQKGLRT